MNPIIMKVHKHDDSTRLTIPKEIIRANKWEHYKYFSFTDNGDGSIELSPILSRTTHNIGLIANEEQISINKT